MTRSVWAAPPGNPKNKVGFSAQVKGQFTSLQHKALEGKDGSSVDKSFSTTSPAYPWLKNHHILRDCTVQDDVWYFNQRAGNGEWVVDQIPIASSANRAWFFSCSNCKRNSGPAAQPVLALGSRILGGSYEKVVCMHMVTSELRCW